MVDTIPVWKVYCATEDAYKYILSVEAPTSCPTHPNHVLSPTSPASRRTARMVAAACVAATTTSLPDVTQPTADTLVAAVPGRAPDVDGVTIVAGDRVLVKDQISCLQNGTYTLTVVGSDVLPFTLTRATDMASTIEAISLKPWQAPVPVVGGASQGGRAFAVRGAVDAWAAGTTETVWKDGTVTGTEVRDNTQTSTPIVAVFREVYGPGQRQPKTLTSASERSGYLPRTFTETFSSTSQTDVSLREDGSLFFRIAGWYNVSAWATVCPSAHASMTALFRLQDVSGLGGTLASSTPLFFSRTKGAKGKHNTRFNATCSITSIIHIPAPHTLVEMQMYTTGLADLDGAYGYPVGNTDGERYAEMSVFRIT